MELIKLNKLQENTKKKTQRIRPKDLFLKRKDFKDGEEVDQKMRENIIKVAHNQKEIKKEILSKNRKI